MNHMQRPAQGLQNWRRQLAPVSEKNMYRYNVPFYELCFNYIIYAKACARTADLVLVIGTSLSGLASDCVPEVGRRHGSECCCCCCVIVIALYCCCCCTLLFFCVASSWNTAMWFRILLLLLFFCCCVVIQTSLSGLVYDCIPVEESCRCGSEFLLLFFVICCAVFFVFFGVASVGE